MNKKLLSGLCAAVLLSGLVGCGPKEPKQDTTTSTSTNETKETENNTTTTANNSEVTEKNFKDFPETDKKYFSYNDWNEGIVIEGCSSEEKVVVVPKEINGKPVLAIGERGLANMQNCEAVVLPDTVRVISKSAFTVDKVMKFVYLGTSLEKIDDLAFNGCSKLEFVEFPEGLESIGKLTFSHNVVIKYIKIPASVTEITDVFYFPENSNKNVEIHTPKGSKAEEVANHLGLKVVND